MNHRHRAVERVPHCREPQHEYGLACNEHSNASSAGISRRALLALAAMTTLSGCGRRVSYRYKLTLSVDTPDGIKTAFNVVEVSHNEVSFPHRGVASHVRGEALYLDLGPGNRPLVSLLTKRPGPKGWKNWEENRPTLILARLYSEKLPVSSVLEAVSRFSRLRGPHEITLDDLPDLVTFSDINDPRTVMAVDPENLSGALDRSVSWQRVTLEVTDAPLTTGIEKKLPWLPALKGSLGRDMQLPYGHFLRQINDGSFWQGSKR